MSGRLGRGRQRLGLGPAGGVDGPGGGGGEGSATGIPDGVREEAARRGGSRKGARRGPQRRRIPGKSRRREYVQAVTQMREECYVHVMSTVKGRRDLQELIAAECRRYGVEPGGGKPSYGYSELVEMLVMRWLEDEAGSPVP